MTYACVCPEMQGDGSIYSVPAHQQVCTEQAGWGGEGVVCRLVPTVLFPIEAPSHPALRAVTPVTCHGIPWNVT